MAEQEVDALLERMPKIAEAVNSFKSEAVQQAALSALIGAFEAKFIKVVSHNSPPRLDEVSSSAVITEGVEDVGGSEERTPVEGGAKKTRRTKGGASYSPVQVVRDLNLRPNGSASFDEFVKQKNPSDNQEKFAVAVYYLE